MSGTTSGHLLIADISGYTTYLTTSELDHAQGVLGTLMELLIDRTLPPLRVSGLEGDAVFSYGIESAALGGQTLVEIVEDTYVAFRRAIELMVMNTTCECNACANISTLDLKFFVHHGTFSVSKVRGNDELVGPAVIAIHRLVKNTIVEDTGIRAYTAYTGEAVAALGLEDITSAFARHTETYSDLGEITLHIQDMHPVWDAKRDTLRVDIAEDDVLVEVVEELPVPLAVAWELIGRTEYRSALMGSNRQVIEGRQQGRVSNDSVFRCFHGKNRVTTQTVIDWQPLRQVITEDTTPVPGTTLLIKLALAPTAGNGTTMTITSSKARGNPVMRFACNVVGRGLLRKTFHEGAEQIRRMIAEEIAAGTLHVNEPAQIDADVLAAAVQRSLATDR